jgi:hypothetical protein
MVLHRPVERSGYRKLGRQGHFTGNANQELTEGLELRCGASIVKTFWQRLVERRRRNRAELDQIVLELGS